MVVDLGRVSNILKKILYIIFIIILIFIIMKLAFFFMPFLLALIIANSIEPIISYICKKTKLVRKVSAIITLVLVFSLLIGIVVFASFLIVSEANNLIENSSDLGNEVLKKISKHICKHKYNKNCTLMLDHTDGAFHYSLNQIFRCSV